MDLDKDYLARNFSDGNIYCSSLYKLNYSTIEKKFKG